MTGEVIAYGERLADQDPDHLAIAAARAAAVAVKEHRDFQLLELRGDAVSEILVVECKCDRVFSKNKPGICYVEPLSLRFFRDTAVMPEVRALRADFPVLLHENQPKPGEPKWLCVYHEPWSQLRRTWTPQKFLARIQWWLEGSAAGTLHPVEQLPEQLYFESPLSIVLPREFDQLASDKAFALELEPRTSEDGRKWVAVAKFKPLNQYLSTGNRHYALLTLTLGAVVHASPELSPGTLGEVHDRLNDRGAPIAEKLFGEMQRLVMGAGLAHSMGQKTLLILTIPVTNPAGGEPRIERKGFLIDAGMGQLGVMAGVLDRDGRSDKYVVALQLGGGLQLKPAWRNAALIQVEVREPFTEERARLYSGVADPGPDGILAGVGALGSAIADLWIREGWGQWRYVDPDLLLPHNLARHQGYEHQVGVAKVDAMRQLEGSIYSSRNIRPGFQASANDFRNTELLNALRNAKLIVDATTTIDVPRDLAMRDDVPRTVSAFVTPSGNDSVMLLEDSARRMRLDVLEAQYYRFVLNAPWGGTHLKGHKGSLWVGAGCRDTSFVISNELIQLHSALLARQIRLRSNESAPHIQVWRSNPETGDVSTTAFAASAPIFVDMEGMELVWDEGLRTKMRAMREQGLPRETGGVLLGHFDLMNSRVYVVDALPAPADSVKSSAEFARGVEGLASKVDESLARTANIVGYVGEWHSHPRGVEADPSGKDIRLLVHLALMLRQDGLPALMLIVGESSEQWVVGAVRG
jgi:integrative and conjugative element protein (TIGR02256 family)